MAEIEFNVLNGQCLNRRIDNIHTVKQEVEVRQDHRNNKNSVINWRFTTKDARIKLKRLYPRIYGWLDASNGQPLTHTTQIHYMRHLNRRKPNGYWIDLTLFLRQSTEASLIWQR